MNIEQYMNKSPKDIYDTYDRLEFAKREFRESARLFLSRLLMDTSEEHPMECDFIVEPEGTFGLSTLEMPHLKAMWMDPIEGIIYLQYEEYGHPIDFDDEQDTIINQIIQEYAFPDN